MTLQVTQSTPPHQSGDPEYVLKPRVEITTPQLECLSWTKEGKSATDIGLILGISGRTVEKRLSKVCKLLGVRTRIQAVIKARDLGLLG